MGTDLNQRMEAVSSSRFVLADTASIRELRLPVDVAGGGPNIRLDALDSALHGMVLLSLRPTEDLFI